MIWYDTANNLSRSAISLANVVLQLLHWFINLRLNTLPGVNFRSTRVGNVHFCLSISVHHDWCGVTCSPLTSGKHFGLQRNEGGFLSATQSELNHQHKSFILLWKE